MYIASWKRRLIGGVNMEDDEKDDFTDYLIIREDSICE